MWHFYLPLSTPSMEMILSTFTITGECRVDWLLKISNLSVGCLKGQPNSNLRIGKDRGSRRTSCKCQLMHAWINKMLYTHTREYFSPLRKKEILTYSTSWMNLKDIQLNEISQLQKEKWSIISLMWGIVVKFRDRE